MRQVVHFGPDLQQRKCKQSDNKGKTKNMKNDYCCLKNGLTVVYSKTIECLTKAIKKN